VLAAIAPGSVDYSFVSPGLHPQQKEANARYALAVARRIGVGGIFMLWTDIVEVQPR